MVSGWRTFSSCEPRRHHAIVFRHNWTLCSEPVWLCSRLPQNLNYHAGKTKRHATSSAISPIVPMLYSTNSWTSPRTSSAMWYAEMSRLAKQQVFSTKPSFVGRRRLAEGSQTSRYSRHAGLLHRIRGIYKASPTVDILWWLVMRTINWWVIAREEEKLRTGWSASTWQEVKFVQNTAKF